MLNPILFSDGSEVTSSGLGKKSVFGRSGIYGALEASLDIDNGADTSDNDTAEKKISGWLSDKNASDDNVNNTADNSNGNKFKRLKIDRKAGEFNRLI